MQTAEIFAGIARKYDTMNRIMSLGLDLFWRRSALREIELPVGSRILDLACGTGDFTLELAKRWPDAEITGVDITPEMIKIAKQKLADARNVAFFIGNAQELSCVAAESCNLVVCAFGFRNFPDKAKALSECRRVLAPGGKLVVLELFRPGSKLLGTAVNAWLSIVSWIFAGEKSKEYQYLRKSVAGTVSAAGFITLAEQNGFTNNSNRFFPPAATSLVFLKKS